MTILNEGTLLSYLLSQKFDNMAVDCLIRHSLLLPLIVGGGWEEEMFQHLAKLGPKALVL